MLRLMPLFALIICCSCAASRSSVAQNATQQVTTEQKSKTTVLTLVLKASWNADSSVHFEVYNDIRNEGFLKSRSMLTSRFGYTIFFTDEAGNKQDSAFIEHPLQDRIETENEQGKLVTKLFNKEEGYTDVRINFKPSMKKIILVNKQNKEQQTINLK